jgi:Icc-related predicted phosphoesterase
MRIVATSDFHGNLPTIPECDLLLIAGDICPVQNHERRYQADWLRHELNPWLKEQPAKEIVAVGGNHDFVLNDSFKFKELAWHLVYNEIVEVEGAKIFGSPMSPRFGNWAFMAPEDRLLDEWDKIPNDVDILMVHGPAYGFGDYCYSGDHAGSTSLRNKLEYFDYPDLKLFVFGHIHEGYGVGDDLGFTWANVSHVNENYAPVNEPMVFEI